MSIDLHAAMQTLSKTRPIFQSEADFQHALAWQLHLRDPELAVRLEYRTAVLPERGYVDLWLTTKGETVAVELKYKTRALHVDVAAETFDLLDQSAQDLARYDTFKDVERVVANTPHAAGFVILLTNDRSYWAKSERSDLADADFRLHHGRTVSGPLKWGAGASAGTRKNREAQLLLTGSYALDWRDYSTVDNVPYGRFRYVLVAIAENT